MKQIISSIFYFLCGIFLMYTLFDLILYFPLNIENPILLFKNFFWSFIAFITYMFARKIDTQNKLEDLSKKNEVKKHLFFWLLCLIYFYLATYFIKDSFKDFVLEFLLSLIFIFPISYFNIYFLIPKYLLYKKYVKYGIGFILSYFLVMIILAASEYFLPIDIFLTSQYFFLIFTSSALFFEAIFFNSVINWKNLFKSIKKHFFVWIISICVIVILPDFLKNNYDYSLLFFQSLFFIIIPSVYINLYFLIPRFLKKNNLRGYLLWLCVLFFIAGNTSLITQDIDKNYTFISFFISTFFAIVIDYIKDKQKLLKYSVLELQSTQSELFALKSINFRHTLKNFLAIILIKVRNNERNTAEMIEKLSEILIFTLSITDKNVKIPLRKDVELINKYIDLQKYRYENELVINFIYNERELIDYLIEPLLIINFIENCFEHGGTNSKKEDYVKIILHVTDNFIHYSIENSKSHYKALNKNISNKTGVGIENVKKRLEIAYPDKYQLLVNEDSDKFFVNLKLYLK